LISRRKKIKIISSSLIAVAICLGIIALRPIFFATTFLASKQSSECGVKDTLKNVHVETYDKQNHKIKINANQAVKNNGENYTLNQMTSTFVLNNGDECTIIADQAKTISEDIIDFKGNVKLKLKSGLLVLVDHALVNSENKTVISTSHIDAKQNNNTLSGDDYFIDFEKKYILVKRNANISNSNANIESNQIDITLTKDGQFKTLLAKGNAKYTTNERIITANEIHYHSDIIEIIGNAQVNDRKNIRISGDKITAILDQSHEIKNANVEGKACYLSDNIDLNADNFIYNNNELIAYNNVVLNYLNREKQKYNITTRKLIAQLDNHQNISKIIANENLTIKTNNDTVKADSGVVANNRLYLNGNISASGEFGDVLGNEAELDLATGEIEFINSSGIIEDEAGRDGK